MKKIMILLIKIYRLCISPFLGECCRFHPTCSQYAITALEKKGILAGSWLITKRLTRCHPWCQGGIDNVPD